MDSDQKKKLVHPWDAGVTNGKGTPARLHTFTNKAIPNSVIGVEYTKKQVEILDRIFHSISNGDEGYKATEPQGPLRQQRFLRGHRRYRLWRAGGGRRSSRWCLMGTT